MTRREVVFDYLNGAGIAFEWYEHPEAPTADIARQYWRNDGSAQCKNLFFRNHKGDCHYLVIFDAGISLPIRDLEKRLRQGKLSFASEQRMERYLGLKPGSVSPFGLINDTDNHIHLFVDENLQNAKSLSFHPNDNTATIVILQAEFMRFLERCGNSFEFSKLYEISE
jgi:Uncharacterized conserved protein